VCWCVGSELCDISAVVKDPSGVEDCCDIASDPVSQGVYEVIFKPRQCGVHLVSVRHQQSPVPGKHTKETLYVRPWMRG